MANLVEATASAVRKRHSFFLLESDTRPVLGIALLPGNILVDEDEKGRLTAGNTLSQNITREHSFVRHLQFKTRNGNIIRLEPTATFRIVA